MSVQMIREALDVRRQTRAATIVGTFLDHILDWEPIDEEKIIRMFGDKNIGYFHDRLSIPYVHDPLSYITRYLRQKIFDIYREQGAEAAQSVKDSLLKEYSGEVARKRFTLSKEETCEIDSSISSLVVAIEKESERKQGYLTFPA